MSLTLAAGVAAGAASGAAGGILNKEEEASVPEYTEHEKKLTTASQFLIPQYLRSLVGGQTPYTRSLMQQLRSQGAFSAQQNVGGFLRNVGMRTGGDFGPAATGQLGQIYGGITPAIMQAISQARLQQMQQATSGLQAWSLIKPGTATQPKSAGPGKSALAGGLQGLGRGLGGMSFQRAPAKQSNPLPNSSLPPAQQGPVRQSVQVNEGLQAAQQSSVSPFFPKGMYPQLPPRR